MVAIYKIADNEYEIRSLTREEVKDIQAYMRWEDLMYYYGGEDRATVAAAAIAPPAQPTPTRAQVVAESIAIIEAALVILKQVATNDPNH